VISSSAARASTAPRCSCFVTRDPLPREADLRSHQFTDVVWIQVTGDHDEQALETAVDRLIGKLFWEQQEGR
jgi:hypothetical protein